MSDLAEFLLARIAEDEAIADAVDSSAFSYDVAANREVWADGDRVSVGVGRVVAECEAKRQIVEHADPDSGLGHLALRELAAIYAEHPDFREEWRP